MVRTWKHLWFNFKRNVGVRKRFRIENAVYFIRRNTWFGHVERKSEDDEINQCIIMLVDDGKLPRAKPKKMLLYIIMMDLRKQA
jgi:hypothetical protein